jgi:hypothetical protein
VSGLCKNRKRPLIEQISASVSFDVCRISKHSRCLFVSHSDCRKGWRATRGRGRVVRIDFDIVELLKP